MNTNFLIPYEILKKFTAVCTVRDFVWKKLY